VNWTNNADTLITTSAFVNAALIYARALYASHRPRSSSYQERLDASLVTRQPHNRIPLTRVASTDGPRYAGDADTYTAPKQSSVRSPFAAQPRIASAGSTAAPQPDSDRTNRPTFKRSNALQRRIALREGNRASVMVMLSRSQEAELPRRSETRPSRRPTFRRSTALQQRIALREGPASSVAVELSRPPAEARRLALAGNSGRRSPRFERDLVSCRAGLQLA
jgi:hypothetical protein